jgi:ribosomal protein S14
MLNNKIFMNSEQNNPKPKKKETQPCPNCGEPIGVLSGSFDAICKNCGFKDPCCE